MSASLPRFSTIQAALPSRRLTYTSNASASAIRKLAEVFHVCFSVAVAALLAGCGGTSTPQPEDATKFMISASRHFPILALDHIEDKGGANELRTTPNLLAGHGEGGKLLC